MASTRGGKPRYRFRVGDDKTGQCSECGEVFFGERSFDRHRRGPHEPGGRYCVDPATEPPAEKSGAHYWVDDKGRWHYGLRMSDKTMPERFPLPLQGCEQEPPGVITLPAQLNASQTGFAA